MILMFSFLLDCIIWVIGGFWFVEFLFNIVEIVMFVEYLKVDLYWIVGFVNDELMVIWCVGMVDLM